MPQIQILDGRSDSIHPGSSIQMDKDHLPLLEDQNPVRRSEILSGTGRVKISLTNAVKSLSNVSGREADVTNIYMHQSVGSRSRRLHQCSEGSHLIRVLVYLSERERSAGRACMSCAGTFTTIHLFTQPQGRTSGLNARDQSVDDITMPGWAFNARFTIAV